jgi:CheY-like chemotaxis protein
MAIATYRLLIIDDDRHAPQLVEALIAEHSEYTISCVHAPMLADGIAMAKNPAHNFHMAILDQKLPDADGLYGLEEWLEKVPETPVIMLTGYFRAGDAIKARRMGAQGYFAKLDLTEGKGNRGIERFIDAITEGVERHQRTLAILSWKKDLEDRVAELENRFNHAEQRAANAETRAAQAEEKAAKADARSVALDGEVLRLTNLVNGKNGKPLLDKKSKIAIITAAIVAGVGALIAGFWEVIKTLFTRGH